MLMKRYLRTKSYRVATAIILGTTGSYSLHYSHCQSAERQTDERDRCLPAQFVGRQTTVCDSVNFTVTLSATFFIIQGDPHRPTQMDPTRPDPWMNPTRVQL